MSRKRGREENLHTAPMPSAAASRKPLLQSGQGAESSCLTSLGNLKQVSKEQECTKSLVSLHSSVSRG